MIDTHRILHVQHLLLEKKYSQREIAQMAGVSRSMVQNIIRGKFSLRNIEEIKIKPEGDFVRCPQCGGKTRLPCTYCAIRNVLKSSPDDAPWRLSTDNTSSSDTLEGVQLKGMEMKRYQKIRKWREKQRDPRFTEIPPDWPWQKKSDDTK